MIKKSLSIVLVFGVLLSSCSTKISNENVISGNENTSKTRINHRYTLNSNLISSNYDNEFMLKYEEIRQSVLKEDYKKAFLLAKNLSYDGIEGDIWYNAYKLMRTTKKIKTSTNNYEAYNTRGKYRYEFGDKKGALKDINKALKINPYYSIAYMNRADIEQDSKEYEKAKKDYNLAIKYAPYNHIIYEKKGNLLYKLNSYKEAIDTYTKAIDIDKKAYYIMCRALAYYHLGDRENSLKNAKQAEKLFKKNKDKRYKLAQKLQDTNLLQDNSIKEIETELLGSNEDSKLTALWSSDTLPNDKDVIDAKKYYDILFNSNTKDETIIRYQEAYKNLIKGNYEKARKLSNCKEFDTLEDLKDETQYLCRHFFADIGILEDYSKSTSRRYHSWNFIGSIKLRHYDKKGALKAFNKAIELNPYYSEAYLYRALIKKDNGDYEEAIKDINFAIQYDPYNAELYYIATRFFIYIHIEELQKGISNPNMINEIVKNTDKAISIVPKTKYLLTRAAHSIVLDSIEEKYLKQARADILLALEQAKKANNKKDIKIANKILEEIIQREGEYANNLVPMSIYDKSRFFTILR